MGEVGASEAKTHLSAPLESVESGEHITNITIARRGKPVAKLVLSTGFRHVIVLNWFSVRTSCERASPRRVVRFHRTISSPPEMLDDDDQRSRNRHRCLGSRIMVAPR